MSRTIFLLAGLVLVACCVHCLPGGWEDLSVDDEDVLTAAREAARGLSKSFAGPYHHRLAKVLRAKKQVVAGMNYKMNLVVGMTNCKKTEVEFDEADTCEFKDDLSTYKKCSAIVNRDLKGQHRLVTYGCVLVSKKDL